MSLTTKGTALSLEDRVRALESAVDANQPRPMPS